MMNNPGVAVRPFVRNFVFLVVVFCLSLSLHSGGKSYKHVGYGHVLTMVNITRSDRKTTFLSEPITNQVIKGDNYTITFTFVNNTGHDFIIDEVNDGSDMAGFTRNSPDSDSCKKSEILAYLDDCHIIGIYKPDKPGDTLQTLSVSIKYNFFGNAAFLGSAESRREVTVLAGKFEYKRNGIAINSLSLTASGNEQKETIKLTNAGKARISDMTVTIPPEIASFVSKAACDALALLGAGLSCDLTITLPKKTDLLAQQIGGQYAITTTSENADNAPAIFYLNILTQ